MISFTYTEWLCSVLKCMYRLVLCAGAGGGAGVYLLSLRICVHKI